MLSDEELNQLENERQKDSDWVLQKLNLPQLLQKFGQVRIVGAKALRLMVAKDIDISVVVDRVSTDAWQQLVRELMMTPHIRNISAIDYYNYDEQNRYDPANGQKYSLYVSINNILGPEGDKFDTWECQIHLIEPNMYDAQKITTVQNNMNSEYRITILRLKYWAHNLNNLLMAMTNGNYKIASPTIYHAVLNDKVESIERLVEHVQPSVPHQFRDAFAFALTQINQ